MTTKQFNWLKSHQPFHVHYFELYECKKSSKHHPMSRVEVEFNGNYFVFRGVYHTFNGRFLEEHAISYKVHYRNIMKLRYSLNYNGRKR